jgi:hypothetical protein
MKDKKEIVLALRIAIIAFALVGVAFCAYWAPFSIKKIYPEAIPWLEVSFYWVTSAPCFVILGLAWDVTNRFGQGKFFEERSAKDIEISGWILGIDSLLFIVGNIVVYFLKPNGYEFLYWVLGVAGFCLSILFLAIARYVKAAEAIKEENEAIV